MKDNILKTLQKFINTPFRYSDFIVFMNKQMDFLLQPNCLSMDKDDYNALWDTLLFLDSRYKLFNEECFIIGNYDVSVSLIFSDQLIYRQAFGKTQEEVNAMFDDYKRKRKG